jgi:hypothetical protein
MLPTIPATECRCRQRSLMWPRDTACLSSHAARTQLAQELRAAHSGSQQPSAERPGSVRVENAAPPCLPARCRDCTKLILCPHEILLRLFSAVAACRQGLRAVRSSAPSPCTLVPEPAHPTSEGARPVREGQNSWTARCWPSSPDVAQDSGETETAGVVRANPPAKIELRTANIASRRYVRHVEALHKACNDHLGQTHSDRRLASYASCLQDRTLTMNTQTERPTSPSRSSSATSSQPSPARSRHLSPHCSGPGL